MARKAAGLSTGELGRLAAPLAGRPAPISASAVRNQENGTNGIPYIVADAYAKVLGVAPGWILFGEDRSKSSPPPAVDDASPDLGQWLVSIDKAASGNFIEPMPAAGAPATWAFLPSFTGSIPLGGVEVYDRSLAPIYPQGSTLFIADPDDVDIRDNDHLLVSTLRDGVLVEAIRAVKSTVWGASLIGVGEAPQPELRWVGRNLDSKIYCVGVVVGASHEAHRAGRRLLLPRHATYGRGQRRKDEPPLADIRAPNDPDGGDPT
jgi:hypothetical protein